MAVIALSVEKRTVEPHTTMCVRGKPAKKKTVDVHTLGSRTLKNKLVLVLSRQEFLNDYVATSYPYHTSYWTIGKHQARQLGHCSP